MSAQDGRFLRLADTLGSEKNAIAHIAVELKRRNWTQAELVRRLRDVSRARGGQGEIHPVVLSKLLGGDRSRHISIDQLLSLAQVFEMPVAELLLPPGAKLPEKLARAAERAVLMLHEEYQLSQQAEDAGHEYEALLGQLEEGLAGDPDMASKVLELFDALVKPDWVMTDPVESYMVEAVRARMRIEGN